MEFEGKYRVKQIMSADDDGIKYVTRDDIAAMEMNEFTEDYIRMLKMVIDVKEDTLLVKFKVNTEEVEMAKAEDPDIPFDEDGLLILEGHEIKNVDGQWMFECGEEDGEPCYAPFMLSEDGDLMYGESIVLEKI